MKVSGQIVGSLLLSRRNESGTARFSVVKGWNRRNVHGLRKRYRHLLSELRQELLSANRNVVNELLDPTGSFFPSRVSLTSNPDATELLECQGGGRRGPRGAPVSGSAVPWPRSCICDGKRRDGRALKEEGWCRNALG